MNLKDPWEPCSPDEWLSNKQANDKLPWCRLPQQNNSIVQIVSNVDVCATPLFPSFRSSTAEAARVYFGWPKPRGELAAHILGWQRETRARVTTGARLRTSSFPHLAWSWILSRDAALTVSKTRFGKSSLISCVSEHFVPLLKKTKDRLSRSHAALSCRCYTNGLFYRKTNTHTNKTLAYPPE